MNSIINDWKTISVSILQSQAFDKNDHRNILIQTFTRDPVFKNKNCILFIASVYSFCDNENQHNVRNNNLFLKINNANLQEKH